jgi:hypothetical protein
LTTEHLNPQTVVLEIAEPVGLSVDGFHFVVETFGDAVGSGEAPHAYDLFSPGVKRVAERNEAGQTRLAEFGHGTREARHQVFALAAGLVLLQQQVAEALFEAIDDVQGETFGEMGRQADLLLGFEVVTVTVAAHQGEQAAVLDAGRVDLAPAGQEVLGDEANDVEAVGHDDGIGEKGFDDGAVDRGQVYADDADLVFAL